MKNVVYISVRYKSNVSYLFPRKLQQLKSAEQGRWMEQVFSYKTVSFQIVTATGCAFSPAMNKCLHAALVKICASGGSPIE
jgi:hypothetical protein